MRLYYSLAVTTFLAANILIDACWADESGRVVRGTAIHIQEPAIHIQEPALPTNPESRRIGLVVERVRRCFKDCWADEHGEEVGRGMEIYTQKLGLPKNFESRNDLMPEQLLRRCADACWADENGEEVGRRGMEIYTQKFGLPKDSEPRNDLMAEHLLRWIRPMVVSENSIRVFFMAGDKNCYGYRFSVKETDDSIKIAVVEGSIPEGFEICRLYGFDASFLIHTERPIAGRTITQLFDVELNKEKLDFKLNKQKQ